MSKVTLNQSALEVFMRDAVRERIVSQLNSHPHTNTDGRLSPSEWWVDNARTVRHTMDTSMSATGSGSTITLTLAYNIRTLQV